MLYSEGMTTSTRTHASCPGAGRNWIPGTGHPICPVCHRGVVAITGSRRTMKQMRGKAIPAHTREVAA